MAGVPRWSSLARRGRELPMTPRISAYDLGVRFFDKTDVYGESLIARALGDVRDEIVIANKAAGYTYVEETRETPGENGDPDYLRWACEQSMRRLRTDRSDLYQFHLGGYDLERRRRCWPCSPSSSTSATQGDRLEYRRLDPSGPVRGQTAVPGDPAVVQRVRRERRGTRIAREARSGQRRPRAARMGLLTGRFNATSTQSADRSATIESIVRPPSRVLDAGPGRHQ